MNLILKPRHDELRKQASAVNIYQKQFKQLFKNVSTRISLHVVAQVRLDSNFFKTLNVILKQRTQMARLCTTGTINFVTIVFLLPLPYLVQTATKQLILCS